MTPAEHYAAAERALDGAKQMIKQGEEVVGSGRDLQALERQRRYQDGASLLLGVAGVHARLATYAEA